MKNTPDLPSIFAHDVKHYVMIAEELLQNLTPIKEHEKVKAKLKRTLKKILLETNSVLLASKFEAGLLKAAPLNLMLNEIVAECIEDISVLFESAERKIQFLPDESLEEIAVDPALFPNLLNNLLDNALKYGAPLSPVIVETSGKGGATTLRITSTGPELTKEEMAKLFQPFERGSNSVGKSGSGIGLYIVRLIAEAHGATARIVESERGKTVFEVVFKAS